MIVGRRVRRPCPHLSSINFEDVCKNLKSNCRFDWFRDTKPTHNFLPSNDDRHDKFGRLDETLES